MRDFLLVVYRLAEGACGKKYIKTKGDSSSTFSPYRNPKRYPTWRRCCCTVPSPGRAETLIGQELSSLSFVVRVGLRGLMEADKYGIKQKNMVSVPPVRLASIAQGLLQSVFLDHSHHRGMRWVPFTLTPCFRGSFVQSTTRHPLCLRHGPVAASRSILPRVACLHPV